MKSVTTQLPHTQTPIAVSNATYVTIWAILLLFQTASATILVGAAYIYLHFTDEDSILWYVTYNYLFAEPMLVLTQNHKTVGIGYAIVSVPFIYGATQMIVCSLWQRRLTFGPEQPQQDTSTKSSKLHHTVNVWKERSQSWLASLGTPSLREYADFQAKYAVQVMLVIKTLQLVLQTIQGYRFSKYNSNLAINQVYGVMVFINALSCPVIHFFFSRFSGGHLQQQLYFVLADTALDFTWGIVIQLAMFAPYWIAYVHRGSPEPDAVELAWETNDRQLRQILVVSTINFVLSAFPFITSSLLYHDLRNMLNGAARVPTRSANTQAQSTLQAVAPETSSKFQVYAVGTRSPNTRPSKLKIVTNAYMLLMALYGALILLVSITASGVFFSIEISGVGCVDRLYPWFWQQFTCVGHSINCDSLGISGRKDELKHVLQKLHPFLTGRVEFHNCNNLEMPANIRQYNALVTLMVDNAKIMDWGVDAALTDESFPSFQTLMITDVHVVGIPDGFTKNRLPSAFQWMYFLRVNVNDFVDKLSDDVWSGIWMLAFDECQLTHIPRVVTTMPNLIALSARYNPITAVETDDFNTKLDLLFEVRLDNTSITSLSNATWELFARQLKTLTLQSSNLSSIPEHVNDFMNPLLTVRAYDTPLCAAMKTSSVPRWPWVECDFVYEI